MQPTIMWFRRDLRLADHPALRAAASAGNGVIGLFVVDPAFERAGAPRRAFLGHSLAALNESMGGALQVRSGWPETVLAEIARDAGVSDVFVTRDHGPYGRQRDDRVEHALAQVGVHVHRVGSNYAVEPGSVRKPDGSPYAVFTPFSRAWERIGWPRPTESGDVDWVGSKRAVLPSQLTAPVACELPPPGEAAAHARWAAFLDHGLAGYATNRDIPGCEGGTSEMSAYLRWGVVHPRQLLTDLDDSASAERVRAELGWRDFYADVLWHRPESAWSNLQRSMDAMRIDTDAAARQRFACWQRGETGFPIVDAGMRQLLATGWMHNRVRMIVASFLVKDLHLPWQWGARHFMEHLVDGDRASNSHGWQWAAGTGTDAAPYFRVFNPTMQGQTYDPNGAYVRRWVPELGQLPDVLVHEPCRRGASPPLGYVAPMVDHAAERAEALARYAECSPSRLNVVPRTGPQ